MCWLHISQDANKATDSHRNTFWGSVTAEFKERMAALAEAGSVSETFAANAAARGRSGIEKHFRKISHHVFKLTTARLAVENEQLTGNPNAEDMELAMMARFEMRDAYEAIQVGQYEPNPSLAPERRAIRWMGAWRVLRHSAKFSGAAAAAAHAARRGETRDDDGSEHDEVWDVDAGAGTVREHRKQRAAALHDRQPGVQSVRASAASQAATARDSRAGTKALEEISGSLRDRAMTALMSCPALRDEPRFKEFLAKRADEMIAATTGGRGGPSRTAPPVNVGEEGVIAGRIQRGPAPGRGGRIGGRVDAAAGTRAASG